jgi:hypothetical protein
MELHLLSSDSEELYFKYEVDNRALGEACRDNNKEQALLMIKKGATRFGHALRWACFEGHKEMVLLMIPKIKPSRRAIDFSWGLTEACFNNHRELVLLMIDCGATECLWCNKAPNEH